MTAVPATPARRGRTPIIEQRPAIVDDIERAIRAGASIVDAAGAAGVAKSSVMSWSASGRDARSRRDSGEELTPRERLYLDFVDRMERAEHEAKVEALAVIRRAIVGWDEEETRTVEKAVALLDADGQPVLDASGAAQMVVVSRTTTTTSGRKFAWAAAMTWLERRYPAEFARLMRQELSGPNGGPVEIEDAAVLKARALERVDEVGRRRAQHAIAEAASTNGHATGTDDAEG